MYVPMFRSVKTGTHLITNNKYDMLVNLLQLPLPKGATNTERNYQRKYRLGSNVANRCLYRGDKVVTTLEGVYEVILEAHSKINHARSVATNKRCINDQLGYYGVPKDAVECFVKTCPKCCAKVVITKARQRPLKMILPKKVGSRFQMDLVEMPEYNGFRYILRVVSILLWICCSTEAKRI